LAIKLYDGTRYEEMQQGPGTNGKTYPASRLNFKSYELKFDLSEFKLSRTKEELFKENSVMLNINQLQVYVDSLKKKDRRLEGFAEDLTKTYQLALRDTNVVKKDKTVSVKIAKIPQNTPLIATLPIGDQKNTI